MRPPITPWRAGWRQEIDRAWAASPNPGRISAVHRLNRSRIQQRDSRPVRARPRCEAAAARRRDGGRQLRQLRGCPLDFDGPPRAIPVGGASGHAARDGSASRAVPALETFEIPLHVRAGRPAERRPAVRISRRHRDSPRLSGRRRVPDQGSSPAAVSGLHHGHGLAAAARRPPRWQAAEAVHRRRRSARAGPPRPVTPATANRALPAIPNGKSTCRSAATPGLEVRVPVEAGPRVVGVSFVQGAVGAGRPPAAAATGQGPDERPGLHGLRERGLGPDRRPVTRSPDRRRTRPAAARFSSVSPRLRRKSAPAPRRSFRGSPGSPIAGP